MHPAAIWLIVGLVLMAFEVATPGFILFFFGLAAVTVSGVVYVANPETQVWPIVLFVVLSIVYILALRKVFKNIFYGKTESNRLPFAESEGQVVTVTRAITPNVPGRVEFQGTEWEAQSEQECAVGTRVKIESKESLTLFVKPL